MAERPGRRKPYGTWTCRFCNLIFETKAKLWEHYHTEHKDQLFGPYGKGKTAWNKGLTAENNESILKAKNKLNSKYKSGELKGNWTGKHHSEETKRRISESRSQWLKDHPDNHPWRRSSKFKSVPCELLKDTLRKAGISFIEEYSGFEDHNYSIDIAFPNDKIGIEVNGNQHYNKDGTLTEYYKKREDYLKTLGWKLHQIHYSLVYNQDFINALIEGLKKDIKDISIVYPPVTIRKKEDKKCKSCGKYLNYDLVDGLCKSCINKEKNKELTNERLNMVKTSDIDFSQKHWTSKVGKLLGVSPQHAFRWIKKYMPDTFENVCYRYDVEEKICPICGKPVKIHGESVHPICKLNEERKAMIEEKKNKVLASLDNLKIGETGWISRLSRLLKMDRHRVKKFIEKEMPDLLS